MNVGGLYSALGNSALTSLQNVGSVGTSNASGSISAPAAGAESTSISAPGQFFSTMQQLSQSNPAEFQSVAAQVATTFQKAASQASGPEAQFLSNLASQFSQAAQTGALQPPQGAPGPQGGQAGQSTQGVQTAQGAHAAAASPAGPVAPGTQGSGSGGGHHHHHRHGGGSSSQSSAVQQAFQSAIGILDQATQSTSTSTSTPPGSSTTT